ncbi:MAG: RidA family protein [Stellaceae bacterium]
MKEAVDTGLKPPSHPLEWAIIGGGTLYTSHIAMKPDGSRETGDFKAQAQLTFNNLKRTVEAAGGTMADVTQVIVYLTKRESFAEMNEIYARCFPKPYPNRATIIANLVGPEALIEIVAYAHLATSANHQPRSQER